MIEVGDNNFEDLNLTEMLMLMQELKKMKKKEQEEENLIEMPMQKLEQEFWKKMQLKREQLTPQIFWQET